MSENNHIYHAPGNRANLRSSWLHMIRRVNGVTNHLGTLSDFLVSTIAGMFMSLIILGLGILGGYFILLKRQI